MKKQDKESYKKDAELIRFHIEKINIELRDNKNITNELIKIIKNVCNSRNDIWDWAISIVDSYSYNAYRDFLRTNLNRKLPINIERSIFYAYNDLEGLMHMVNKSYYGHRFYLSYEFRLCHN